MKKKKAFTLVELLAVIVILAIILIIAIPQIMKTIKTTRLKSIEDSAILIATNADKDYLAQQAINSNYNATSIPCTDVAKLSKDYASCTIRYNDSGVATVKLKGASGGKFSGITCTGTKDNMNCVGGYTDAAEYLAGLCTSTCPKSEDNDGTVNENGMIQDKYGNYRYQGSDPNNYVTFNDETWRIIGLFDVDGEQRVKLVRKDGIGYFSWDSSLSSAVGINQWGPSTYADGTPYEGADLMRELNGDYLNSSLSENTNWYCGSGNNVREFNKDYVLKNSAQELIGDATWYLGGFSTNTISKEDAYIAERGEEHILNPKDGVIRTHTWVGKVGLIYPSDFAYASGGTCPTLEARCGTNWMKRYGWTITSDSSNTTGWVWSAYDDRMYNYGPWICGQSIKPSVYLIPGVQIKGSGTTSDPYIFAE